MNRARRDVNAPEANRKGSAGQRPIPCSKAKSKPLTNHAAIAEEPS